MSEYISIYDLLCSEYVSKLDVLDMLVDYFGEYARVPTPLEDKLNDMESADVVEVIRCKNCKYYIPISERIGECKDTRMNSTYMNYCGYAERKTNDE